jgi:aminoglycoside 3-N-acetyltransferase
MTITQVLKERLPVRLVREIRAQKKSLGRIRDRLLSVDRAAFERGLLDVGVEEGDTLYVRSAFDDMQRIRATSYEIATSLCVSVGDEGTVVMPTYPTNGLTYPYLMANPRFHWRRTPSLSGLLTEVFRRLPDAHRSLHPTHSVAARGRLAVLLTEGHEDSETPFDERSPYQKLLQHDAKILSIGRFNSIPLRHLADHLCQDIISHPIYCSEPIAVELVGRDETKLERRLRTHSKDVQCNHEVAFREMAREGLLSTARVGGVPLVLVRLRTFVDAYRRYCSTGMIRHVPRKNRAASS